MLCGVERMAICMLTRLFQRSGSMNVEMIKENEDGSASYSFDLTSAEVESLIRFGILEALKAAVREGDTLKAEGEDVSS